MVSRLTSATFLGVVLVAAGRVLQAGSQEWGTERASGSCHVKFLLFYTCITPEVDNQCDEGYIPEAMGGKLEN